MLCLDLEMILRSTEERFQVLVELRREGMFFLFLGTLLVECLDIITMTKALRIPIEKLKDKEIDQAKDRVTCLKWELAR